MKKQSQNVNILEILPIVAVVILALIGLAFIAFEIYLWIHYGNMPADQIPAWVWWWMIGRN